MCDICKVYEINSKLANGDKKDYCVHLYKVFQDRSAKVHVCHLHGRELFMNGEIRFLKKYLKFAQHLFDNRSNF